MGLSGSNFQTAPRYVAGFRSATSPEWSLFRRRRRLYHGYAAGIRCRSVAYRHPALPILSDGRGQLDHPGLPVRALARDCHNRPDGYGAIAGIGIPRSAAYIDRFQSNRSRGSGSRGSRRDVGRQRRRWQSFDIAGILRGDVAAIHPGNTVR